MALIRWGYSMNKRLKKKKKKKATLALAKKRKSDLADASKFNSPEQSIIRVVALIEACLSIAKRLSRLSASKPSHRPPQLGEFALYMILSKEDREYLIGDLEEEFVKVQAKFGTKKARVWYYKQVLTSAWPMIRKALRFGLLAWIGEWFRRRI